MNRFRLKILFGTAALLASMTALLASDLAKTSVSDFLPHQQVHQLLLNSDEVVPPRPNLHPSTATYNLEAVIPPQCYTRTEGKHNPCYVCHQDAIPKRENVMNDGGLQAEYSFSDLGLANHWENLFHSRLERINKISDEEILLWINQDNYSELAPRLKAAKFEGWMPDLKNLQDASLAFDKDGFAKDGSHWVAFNYKPFPSTFWPTNGATDDVMIRLSESYRTNEAGEYSKDIYKANLAILEAKIKGFNSISSLPIDETKVGVDLNEDGKFSLVEEITKLDAYVGAASEFFIDTYVYPQDTEFLHTVRYVAVSDEGDITHSTRMKEVRYMKKWQAFPKGTLARYYEEEQYEKEAGKLPSYSKLGDYGLDNGMGWSVQGFIENKNGRLRMASHEENLFCMGCHGSIGSTIDKTFSFARKVDGAKGWGYINLKGMPDAPSMGETKGEFLTYFERVGGGNEFRGNAEAQSKWFNEDGSVNIAAVTAADVYTLATPSPERATQLNKAYKTIVEDQTFYLGRDAVISVPKNVYREIDNGETPTLPEEFQYEWDIRLNWNALDNAQVQVSQ
jgi:hypothetical protein